MKTANTTNGTTRHPRFGANVIANIQRRNGKETVQDKPSPNDNDFLDDLTATEQATLLRIHTDVTTRLINMKQDAFHIGELLHQAKKILPHGKFTPWIECFFGNDLPYSTAYFHMRVYEVFQDNESAVKKIPTQHLLMLTHKDFPKELLDDMKKHPEKFDSTALKQVSEVYTLWKKGKIRGSQFLRLAKEQIKIGIDIAHKSTRHRINSITRMSLELGAGDTLKRIRQLREKARQMAGLHPYDPKSEGHRQLMEDIDNTIVELQKLKVDLEGGDGMWRTVSTENGDKEI